MSSNALLTSRETMLKYVVFFLTIGVIQGFTPKMFESSCDHRNTRWFKKRVSEEIKTWIDSVKIIGDKSPYNPIEIKYWHFKADKTNALESIKYYDSMKKSLKGWKIAYHYKAEHRYHAGYFYGSMENNGKVTGKSK